jgi:LPXTG-motif cell wall-anchored protein
MLTLKEYQVDGDYTYSADGDFLSADSIDVNKYRTRIVNHMAPMKTVQEKYKFLNQMELEYTVAKWPSKNPNSFAQVQGVHNEQRAILAKQEAEDASKATPTGYVKGIPAKEALKVADKEIAKTTSAFEAPKTGGANTATPGGTSVTPETGKTNWLLWGGIGAGVLVIGGIIFWFIKKKKK